LVIGGTPYLASGTPPGLGNFSTYTVLYHATQSDAGAQIGINLASTGSQGTFDNVRLDAVPEPASLALIGLGLTGIGLLVRRKRA
jgi:hypothetical protein